MNISLTDYWINYVESLLHEGRYQNASELVREALRVHEREAIARDVAEVGKVFGAKKRPATPAELEDIQNTIKAMRKEKKGSSR